MHDFMEPALRRVQAYMCALNGRYPSVIRTGRRVPNVAWSSDATAPQI